MKVYNIEVYAMHYAIYNDTTLLKFNKNFSLITVLSQIYIIDNS